MSAMTEEKKQISGKKLDPDLSGRRPAIVLKAIDRERLFALLNVASIRESPVGRFLREELDRADVVTSEIAANSLITMGCEVKFFDHDRERIRNIRLVYPSEANNNRCVSVLSSVGSALIGLGPGQSIRWADCGRERSLTVLDVHPK